MLHKFIYTIYTSFLIDNPVCWAKQLPERERRTWTHPIECLSEDKIRSPGTWGGLGRSVQPGEFRYVMGILILMMEKKIN